MNYINYSGMHKNDSKYVNHAIKFDTSLPQDDLALLGSKIRYGSSDPDDRLNKINMLSFD